MMIAVLGAGFSGCTIAKTLCDNGIGVVVFEKNDYVGGLSISKKNNNGVWFEPFGNRIFHTKSSLVKEFVQRFGTFNSYVHRKGIKIHDNIYPYPLSLDILKRFPEHDLIINEINNLPREKNTKNFETITKDIFGKTLYELMIKNYSTKMWGCNLSEIESEWAPKRLEIREKSNLPLFVDQWQGVPTNGYSNLFDHMTKNIDIVYNHSGIPRGFDFIISTAPIDEIMNHEHGKLPYRGMKFYYEYFCDWENKEWGTINLPTHHRYIRKCNFNIVHKQEHLPTFVQFQEPCDPDKDTPPMYPINSKRSERIYNKYVEKIVDKNILPAGRLGLFKYFDMDKSVLSSMKIAEGIGDYMKLTSKKKIDFIKDIRRT